MLPGSPGHGVCVCIYMYIVVVVGGSGAVNGYQLYFHLSVNQENVTSFIHYRHCNPRMNFTKLCYYLLIVLTLTLNIYTLLRSYSTLMQASVCV